jgi:hypothetical protein
MVQSIGSVVTNLIAACTTLYASTKGTDDFPVLISFGPPGKYQPNVIVAVGMDIRMPIARPTISTNRSREMASEIDIVFSVFVPGDEDSMPIATAAAFSLFSQLETYLRVSPNEGLGGACRDSWLSIASLVPRVAYQSNTDPNVPPVPVGRVVSLTATLTALIRY